MKPIHILLVEDNEGDILLTQEALEDAKIVTQFSVTRDGKEAIDFLTQQGKYQHVNLPALILLDVNLPLKNGYEVLRFIKAHETLKLIPVIMLTTSSSKRDMDEAYDNQVNCYITKPVEINDFITVITAIENFWISIVELPEKKEVVYNKR
ncbi:MAG: response regulator [Rhizobacter sp.]|nr:response regulator [Ferruginibacter sp.]